MVTFTEEILDGKLHDLCSVLTNLPKQILGHDQIKQLKQYLLIL